MRAHLGFGLLTGAGANRAGIPIRDVAVVVFITIVAVATVAANAAGAPNAALACGVDRCSTLRLPSIATPRLLHFSQTCGAATGRAHGDLRRLPRFSTSHLANECGKIGCRATGTRLGLFIVCWPGRVSGGRRINVSMQWPAALAHLSPLAPPGQTKAPSPPQEYKAQLDTKRINTALWWSKFENDDADREC